LVGNSGNFIETTPLIWDQSPPFQGFLRFSEWLYGRTGRTDSIALSRLMELIFEFLTRELRSNCQAAAETLWRDYQRGGRHDKPGFLKHFLSMEKIIIRSPNPKTTLSKRQARHLV
jgi:hypothetical protein